MSPALAGRFLTSVPTGKSLLNSFEALFIHRFFKKVNNNIYPKLRVVVIIKRNSHVKHFTPVPGMWQTIMNASFSVAKVCLISVLSRNLHNTLTISTQLVVEGWTITWIILAPQGEGQGVIL